MSSIRPAPLQNNKAHTCTHTEFGAVAGGSHIPLMNPRLRIPGLDEDITHRTMCLKSSTHLVPKV